jgi:hypothetical protein
VDCINTLLGQCGEGALEFVGRVAHLNKVQVQSQRPGHGLEPRDSQLVCGMSRVHEHGHTGSDGSHLLEQLELFPYETQGALSQFSFEVI